MTRYDALLLLSFGGPEAQADVIPFLENVLAGKNVPHERLLEVAHHYEQFGGISPLNAQNRALIAALEAEFAAYNIDLPVYWGNRNWHPMLKDTLQAMHAAGIRRVLTLFTSAYGSYSSCRQYQEDIANALSAAQIDDMQLDRLRQFFNHPGFVAANSNAVRDALAQIPAERRAATHIAFTAHSIPVDMAQTSPYVQQLKEVARLVAEANQTGNYALVYQSRSGPPHQPWLEPDICDHIESLAANGVQDIIIAPIGFLSDHMEVIYDLDTEAVQAAADNDINMIRAATAGTHPQFVAMLRQLVQERLNDESPVTLGKMPAAPDVCPSDCCPNLQRMPAHAAHHGK